MTEYTKVTTLKVKVRDWILVEWLQATPQMTVCTVCKKDFEPKDRVLITLGDGEGFDFTHEIHFE